MTSRIAREVKEKPDGAPASRAAVRQRSYGSLRNPATRCIAACMTTKSGLSRISAGSFGYDTLVCCTKFDATRNVCRGPSVT
jgi:hypothetical protein